MSIETSAVQANVTGTSFSVNVTAANLSEDLLEKDFRVLDRTNEIVLDNTYWSKASVNSLSYSGPVVGDIDVEIRRDTPIERYQVVAFSNRFDPTVYNTEVDNILRALYEVHLVYSRARLALLVVEPLQTKSMTLTGLVITYGVGLPLDLYEKFETLAPVNSPTFTGTPSAPSPTLVDNNSTRLATTQFVNSYVTQQNATLTALINDKAPIASPTFTGTPSAPTPVTNDNSTRIATTAMVQASVGAKRPYVATAVIDGEDVEYTYKDDPNGIFGNITRNSLGDYDVQVTGLTTTASISVNCSRDQLATEPEPNNLYIRTRSSSGTPVDAPYIVITIFKL
jgi:hypothetical protein